jgi:O-acetyl-ADP-ribose deacetylase (regulator of RNase III)
MMITVVAGDITTQRVDAIVNAANEHLQHGGGVAAAIVRAGGAVVQTESDAWVREHGPIGPGRAAITTGGDLPAAYVIHVVGPRYRAGAENKGALTRAVTAALDAAALTGCRRVALPAISTGVFGYPRTEAIRVIVETASEWLERRPGLLSEVRLVGHDRAAADDFRAAMKNHLS